jgi:DNA polymerase III epsilon subunit-like protein
MTPQTLFIIDFETTGIPEVHGPDVRPVQVGVVAVDQSLQLLGEYVHVLNPDVWVAGFEHAEAVHGISPQRAAAEGHSMPEGYIALVGWVTSVLARHPSEGSWLSWNSAFDHSVLSLWKRAALPQALPPSMWPDAQVGNRIAPNGCLQAMYREWARGQPDVETPERGSLASACRVLGFDEGQGDTHDALHDARLAWRVARSIAL